MRRLRPDAEFDLADAEGVCGELGGGIGVDR
jgi:hypothetical protein